MSVEDYLESEKDGTIRHEYVDGEVYARSGASKRHNSVAINLNIQLLSFTEVHLGNVTTDDFRGNARGELGTRTATLHRHGIAKLRQNWVYRACE